MKKEPLANFINEYELKQNVKQAVKVSHDVLITKDTITQYIHEHSDENKVYFNKIKTTLQKIRKQEKVILFNEKKIYFHTYRILFIIEQYIHVLDFYNSDEYKKYSFAKHRSDSSKVERKYHKLQLKELDISSYSFMDELKSTMLKQHLSRKELVDLVLNFFTIFPQTNINYEAMSDNKLLIDMIQKVFLHFSSTYINSEDVIYKSLMIVLNTYLRNVMKVDSSYSKKIVNDLLKKLFNFQDETSSGTMLNKIYISGRIANMPIFKNTSKDSLYSEELKGELKVLMQYAQKDFLGLENLNINLEEFFNENPINAYLRIHPMEFMQKIG